MHSHSNVFPILTDILDSYSDGHYTNSYKCIHLFSMRHYLYNCTPVDNTFYLEFYQIHSVPVVNSMLQKTLTIHLINSYLAIMDNEQYHTHLVDMDIMKCLVSK